MFSKIDLRKLIIPLIIEQTLAITIGMIDTIMVSGVGESAISGVAIVDPINILIINLFSALATGGAIVVSQYLGKKNIEKASDAARQLIIGTTLLSVLIMVIFLMFRSQILALVFDRVESNVMRQAIIYFTLTVLSFPFIAIYNSGAALFRAMGNSKISMVNALIMNVINIIGNAIFIYVFKWGVFGAALATLISRIISSISMLIMLRKPIFEVYVTNYSLKKINFKVIKSILSIGIPNGLENSMFQIGKILVVSIVATLGTTAITANAVGGSIASIMIIPSSAIGLAMITVVGRCVGANDFKSINYYTKYLLKVCYTIMIVFNIIVMLSLKPLLGVYNLSDTTFKLTYQILIFYSVNAMIIWPIAFSLPNVFRAASDVKYTMMISIISMWLFRISLSFILVNYFKIGLFAVWIAMIADWYFRALCFSVRWFNGKWKSKYIVQED